VLFLVVCGTIASGDDYDDIVDWGDAHLTFLRGFAEFHFGIAGGIRFAVKSQTALTSPRRPDAQCGPLAGISNVGYQAVWSETGISVRDSELLLDVGHHRMR
jgi:hypothetical protein